MSCPDKHFEGAICMGNYKTNKIIVFWKIIVYEIYNNLFYLFLFVRKKLFWKGYIYFGNYLEWSYTFFWIIRVWKKKFSFCLYNDCHK